jgi:hypothetical protein
VLLMRRQDAPVYTIVLAMQTQEVRHRVRQRSWVLSGAGSVVQW